VPRLLAAVPLLPALACGPGAVCGQGQVVPAPGDSSGAFLYQPDAVLDLQLLLDAQSWEALPEHPGEQEGDVGATLVYAGREWPCGLRLKGASSFRGMDEKAAFKIDFHAWDEDATFFGVRRLTLDNMVQDPSKLSESLSYWLHAAVGGAAPRHGWACLRVGGEDFGLYSLVETMDEQFVAQQFADPTGNLYEGGRGADLRDGRRELFEVEEQGEPAGRGDLQALIDALEAATPEGYLEVLDRHFELDRLLGTLAVEVYLGDVDSYVTKANNFLLYHQPTDGRWTLIPWGADQAFRADLDPYDPWDPDARAEHGRLYEDCLASPVCAAALQARIAEVADLAEAEGLALLADERRAFIADLVRSDPRAEEGAWTLRQAPREAVRFLERRPASVREQLEEGP
jgi:hypothetical protein